MAPASSFDAVSRLSFMHVCDRDPSRDAVVALAKRGSGPHMRAVSSAKRSLPSLGARTTTSGPPTLDEARAALGGRIASPSSASVGTGVRFARHDGEWLEGIVICDADGSLDVWVGDGRFHRIARERAQELRIDPEHALADVAVDALLYATLAEGDPVRVVTRDGQAQDARLVEKHRYGALVGRDAKVFAVSFRRIWPLDARRA